MPSHWTLGFQHVNLSEHKHSDHSGDLGQIISPLCFDTIYKMEIKKPSSQGYIEL